VIGAVSFLRFDVLALWPAFGIVAVLAVLAAGAEAGAVRP
jgi:hypothetical protein